MTIIWAGLRFTEHQHSLLSKKCTKSAVLLERGAASVHNILLTFPDHWLSEILGTDCRVTWRDVTWRDITQEKRLYKHRCENLKFFIIHAILKCVTAHSVSCSNEANLQYGGWRPAVTEVGLIEIVLSAFWKMLQYASKQVMAAITVFPHI